LGLLTDKGKLDIYKKSVIDLVWSIEYHFIVSAKLLQHDIGIYDYVFKTLTKNSVTVMMPY